MSAHPNYSLAESIASLPVEQRRTVLAGLTDQQYADLLYDWRGFWARPNQLPPPGDWRYWLVQAGRGFGKTRTGAEMVRQWVKDGRRWIHLVAPTAADARDVMVEGESGLLSCYPPGARPYYEPSKRMISWPNGAIAHTFGAEEPDRLRGPQCEAAWCDEIAAWKYPETWDNLLFGLRLGGDPRAVITTTPKPTKLVKDLITNPYTVVTRGSSYENRSNLAPAFFDSIIRKYEGTRLGRQELLAELLEDVPGALWTHAMIDAGRIRFVDVRWDLILRVVVAVDPAVTNNEDSDETGIVCAALTRSMHVLVLDDESRKDTPQGWGRQVVSLFERRKADRVVGEVNNGGDLVEGNLRGLAPLIPYRAVRASRGKAKRAEPVAALYEQGRVHHVGSFDRLEEQMCNFVPGNENGEDDRLDALVWAITELLIDPEPERVTMRFNDPQAYEISPV